ncbi:uncharacterized protein LOC110456028 [Mizuhopecten yessoensis]|uniref:CABIT domain-containing protein n=1 Tax=Mizuhopecten yessoensis TaxID=6573 RepID=A0A210QBV3_MIZYE|nr:uncharacterized protein LOC110456028 [Mizuhopecten yessoensis]OWF46213.1 hypothetical protein KP79_PYT08138 [Mizuhopecten yessoensis]
MAASETKSPEARQVRSLKEITECYKLPKFVRVVGGKDLKGVYRRTGIKKGDFIYLHTLAMDNVGLSFFDTDTGSRRVARVPAKTAIKFKIVSPMSLLSSGKQDTPKIFSTVGDLLDVFPMKFKANKGYDDPYLPAIFRKDEVFRFHRKFRSPMDEQIFLECEDEAGNLIQLPKSCHGDFSVLEDDRSYTLQEIISFGVVSRKLKMSSENMTLVAVEESQNNEKDDEEPIYGNITNKELTLSRITGLPLTHKGIITMQKPEVFFVASPRDNLDVRWKLDRNLDLEVVSSTETEYEEPISNEYSLRDFVTEFESEFPITAVITNYKSIPGAFRKHFSQELEVLVHHVEHDPKLLGTTGKDYFSISNNVKGRFRKALRRFGSILDLIELNEPINVKVMEDIASDVPAPFSLRIGDVLVFKSLTVLKYKIKFSKKSYVDVPVVGCYKILEDGSKKTLYLQDDLDLKLIEIPPPGKEKGFRADAVFSGRMSLPMDVDFLPIENARSPLCCDREISMEYVVSDPYVVVSTLPSRRARRTSGLEAKVDVCMKVPIRHDVTLKLSEKLHFPTSYFRFPPKENWAQIDVEELHKDVYDNLVKYSDQAYEDYQLPDVPKASASVGCLVERAKEEEKYNLMKKKNKSMTTLPQSSRQSKKLESKQDDVPAYKSESDLKMAAVNESLQDDIVYADECIYEMYDLPQPKPERPPRPKKYRRKTSKF